MSENLFTRAVTRATVSHVIVRACTVCQHPREQGKPCAGCGNPEPPVVHVLGVQSYTHRNPLKRWGWVLIGQHLAARRVRQVNRDVNANGRR